MDMGNSKYISTNQEIRDAIRRKKRMGAKNQKPIDRVYGQQDSYASFLEMYVFEQLGMKPMQLIQNLETQYYSEQNFRDRRQKNIDFARGRQFGEMTYDAETKSYVSMWEFLKRRNIPPLTYNVISKLVRSLVGQFREINTGNIVKCDSKDDEGSEYANILTQCLERIKANNRGKSKDAKNMKEMLLSGSPVFKVMWGSKDNMSDVDVRYRVVNRAKVTMNPGITDDDLANLHTFVEIHDTSLNDIITGFANGDYEKGMDIKNGYIKHQGNERLQTAFSSQSFDGSEMRNQTFQNQGVGNSSYRYFEVWTLISDYEAIVTDPLGGINGTREVHKWKDVAKVKKEVEAINKERELNSEGIDPDEDIYQRVKADFTSRWYVSFITPWGKVLDVRESPYKSGVMPYCFPPPDINGEIWGIVEEVLDSQLSMDRQIRNADAIIDNASKGVWLIPDKAIPDEMSPREFKQQLKRPDGTIIYKVREDMAPGETTPKQIYANSANVSNNVQQLIQLYGGLVDEISGNYGAAQGKSDSSSKTATGYALESQNAGLNVRDIFETYLTTLVDRDELMLKFILEGYKKEDYLRATGVEVDPKAIRKHYYSIEQSKGTNSPAHRLALEQELLQLVYNELIPFEVFLEISNNPVMIQAKQKLEEHNKKQAELMQQQEMQGGGGGNATAMAPPVPEGAKMVQGHPQGEMLNDSPINQQMPKLSRLPQQNIM